MRASRVRFLIPGDRIRFLPSIHQTVSPSNRAETEALLKDQLVMDALVVPIDGEPYNQTLTLYGPLGKYIIDSFDVEIVGPPAEATDSRVTKENTAELAEQRLIAIRL